MCKDSAVEKARCAIVMLLMLSHAPGDIIKRQILAQ